MCVDSLVEVLAVHFIAGITSKLIFIRHIKSKLILGTPYSRENKYTRFNDL